MPQAPSAVAGSKHVEGVARRVRIDDEGGDCVLRFVVETEDAGLVPVEMRGREVLGVLDDGDRVSFDRGSSAGTARPQRVANLSTKAEVEVSVPGRLGRWSGAVGLRDVRTALISALVTATVGALTNAFESNNTPSATPAPGKESHPSHAVWWVIAGGIAITLVGLALLVWRRRPALARSVLAVTIGCSAGLLALYLLR